MQTQSFKDELWEDIDPLPTATNKQVVTHDELEYQLRKYLNDSIVKRLENDIFIIVSNEPLMRSADYPHERIESPKWRKIFDAKKLELETYKQLAYPDLYKPNN